LFFELIVVQGIQDSSELTYLELSPHDPALVVMDEFDLVIFAAALRERFIHSTRLVIFNFIGVFSSLSSSLPYPRIALN